MKHVSVARVGEAPAEGPCLLWRAGQLDRRTRFIPTNVVDSAYGIALRLQHGPTVLATNEMVCSSASDTAEAVEAAAAAIDPWVPALVASSEADTHELHVERLAYEAERYGAAREEYERWADNFSDARAEEHARVIRHLSTTAEVAAEPDPGALARLAADRLTTLARDARRHLLVVVPDVTIYQAPGPGWTAPDAGVRPRYRPVDDDRTELRVALAVNLLKAWALDRPAARRDALSTWAARAGVIKLEISRLTGISRTTLDRVLKP